MTIIAAILPKDRNGCHFLSDCMISRDDEGNVNLQDYTFNDQAKRSFENFEAVGMVRKIYRFNDRFWLMWAGSVLVASGVIRHLIEIGFANQEVSDNKDPLEAISRKYSKKDLEKSAFIFIHSSELAGDSHSVRCLALNCKSFEDDSCKYILAGTGAALIDSYDIINWYAKSDSNSESDSTSGYARPGYIWLRRAIHADFTGDEVYKNLRTGHWYELLSFDGREIRGIPYFFTKFRNNPDEMDVVYGGIQIRSHYQDDMLFLYQIGTRQIEIKDSDKRPHKILHIPTVVPPVDLTKKTIRPNTGLDAFFLGSDFSIVCCETRDTTTKYRYVFAPGDAYAVDNERKKMVMSGELSEAIKRFYQLD